MEDPRKRAPSVARNRDAILAVLRNVLPARGLVLEVASGSGEHLVYFAESFPSLTFIPSDKDEEARRSIAAWSQDSRLSNIREPLALDAASLEWPIDGVDAIICINMTHISDWSATEGLFRAASRLLAPSAPLYVYGPYRRSGTHTAESNRTFDEWLRSQNPRWGVRDLEQLMELARALGLTPPEIVEMPANNLSLTFRRAAESGKPNH